MARTPLADKLQDVFSVVDESARTGVPAEQVRERRREKALNRRDFLFGAGAVAAAGLALQGGMRPARAAQPSIVVVGAGLAGLSAAYQLKKAGYTAQVYEASDRVGGRCWTLRGAFAEGQIAERGGELIDQGHNAIRNLAQELGLTLDNLHQGEVNGTEPTYYFDGSGYSVADATKDLQGIWQKIHSDVSAASYPTLYNLYTQRGWELDHLSIIDWINESVPGGVNSKLGQLLDVAYNIEYGAECSVQSSLNLLYLLGYVGAGNFRVFGKSDEKYHVTGGNDQITDRMAGVLQGQVSLGQALVAIKKNANNSGYTLTFKSGNKKKDVSADHVVLALPFTILRSSVDFSQAGFNSLKTTAINEQGMGTNSKMHLQFTDRHWNGLGSNGETYADTGYQNSWEVTRTQGGTAGILVNYTGGNVGASFGTGSPASRAQQFLSQIEPVLPGLSSKWNGTATLDYWTGYKWSKGSYSYWKVGQYTAFSGAEYEPSGNCHFAGEHTSIDFQGYLNGAVDTGQRAAGDILAAL